MKKELAELERALVQARGCVQKLRGGTVNEGTVKGLGNWIRRSRKLYAKVEVHFHNELVSGRGRRAQG